MGEGKLLAVARPLTIAALLLATAGAQGVAYRERWGYLQLEARRAEVWDALAGCDAATQARVAGLFCEPDGGVPFLPVAKALASLRGVEADPAFVLRTAVSAFVLPEVCDPEGANEGCRTTNVSLFVPFAIAHPAPVTFAVEVTDLAGKVVWSTTIERDTGERDVRQGRPTASVPCAQLGDGAWQVVVRTLLDGKPPREHDPIVRWTFHVLRGYQARAEAAMRGAQDVEPKLSPVARAWLLGARAEVHRAYTGETFAVASDAVHDLERLERILANVQAEHAVEDGVAGDGLLGLPVAGGPPLAAVLRRAAASGPRPMVVVIAGSPAFDNTGNRPTAPATRDPRWLAHEFAGFDVARRWHVVHLESPGLGRDYSVQLRAALPLLAQVVGGIEGKPLLVCEREAAAIVGLRIAEYRDLVRGFVGVGGGAMAGPALLTLGGLPVRLAAVRGYGEESLQRVIDFVALQQGKAEWRGDVAWLAPERPAWPLALPALAAPLEAFARAVCGP